MNQLKAFGGLIAGLIFAVSTFASTFNNDTGISSPTEVITFSEQVFPDGTLITNQYSGFGVTFSGFTYDAIHIGTFPNVDLNSLTNFDTTGATLANGDPFSIFFTTPVSAAAFALVTSAGTATITAKLGGATVESFSPATTFNSSTDFYGFTGIAFDEIDVAINVSPDSARLDNLQLGPAAIIGATPEPHPLPLLCCGLATLLGLAAWKKRSPE